MIPKSHSNSKGCCAKTMHITRFLLGFVMLAQAAGTLAADLSDARRSLDAGAAQLALRQLDVLPVPPADPARSEQLQLVWRALALGGSDRQVLDHAAALPADVGDDLKRQVWMLAATHALHAGDGPLARTYLQNLIWRLPPQSDAFPGLRAQVVRSHLLPQPDANAVSLLLRDQQEFGPDPALRRDVVLAALEAGQGQSLAGVRAALAQDDPLVWLIDACDTQQDDKSVRQAIGQLLDARPDARVLSLLARPVVALHDDVTQVRYDELALNLATPAGGVDAAALGKAYHGLTQSFANVRLLLFGSDTGWADQARDVQATDPVMARAIWWHLAHEAQDPALRDQAQQQWLEQMLAAHAGRSALRMFEAAWPGLAASSFSAPVRYRLGRLAQLAGEYPQAAALWQDTAILPPGEHAALWQARRTAVFARVGDWPAVAQSVSAWLDQAGAMGSSDSWPVLLRVLQWSRQNGQAAAAQAWLERAFAAGDAAQQRVIASRLAVLAGAGHPLDAARWQLFVAAQGTPADAMLWQGRLDAADSLRAAGLTDDALRVDRGVVEHCSDEALRAMAQDAVHQANADAER